MDDKHIVAQARRGELSAFEELVTRYEKRVYAIALRSSGSPEDAADITQEVFLRAWRSMKDFRGDSGFATWLFRITMNQCVDYARHKQSQPPTQPLVQGEDDEERELPLPDTAPSPEEHLENSELGRELAAALDEVVHGTHFSARGQTEGDHLQVVLREGRKALAVIRFHHKRIGNGNGFHGRNLL